MNRTIRAAAVAALTLLTLAGCGGENAGGETTCADFLAASTSERNEIITTFLKDKGDSDPSNGKVMLTRTSAAAFCNTVGSANDPIRKIDG